MCMHNQDFSKDRVPVDDDDTLKIGDRTKAEDVPLGDGLADMGRNSILQRRERIRAAVAASGG